MSHVALPTSADLGALLYSAGMISAPATTPQSIADYDTALTAASAEWNRVTGYSPFLADATDVTRTFDPPGPTIRGTRYGYRARGGERFLEFTETGLVSLTSLTTGVDSVSTGTVRTLGTDFYLYPANAAAEGRPWTRAEFVLPIWGSQQSVHVVGKWGYAVAVPDDAWEAMLFMAALRRAAALENLVTGNTVETKQADLTKVFRTRRGDGPFAGVMKNWQMHVNGAMERYLRL